MQFSERKELENLITYSKSFKMKDNLRNSFSALSLVDDIIEKDSPRAEIIENDNNVDINQLLAGVEAEKDFFEEIKTYISQLEVSEKQTSLSQNVNTKDKEQKENDENEQAQNAKNQLEQTEFKETKSFSKINEDLLGTYLDKAKDRKSLFTEKLKNNNKPGLSLGQVSAANSKAIRIFFFNSAKNIKLRVFKNTTVAEVLRSAIETYLADPQFDRNLIKYPQYSTEAYEIRILDDDDGYKPDMSFPALDRTRLIVQTQFEQFALIENSTFKPPQSAKDQELNQTFERISKDKNVVVVSVEIRDENQEEMATKIQLDKDQTVGSIFEYLYRKNKKYNAHEYVAKVKFQNDEDFVELDQKMPITLFKENIVEILCQLFKKVWADSSITKQNKNRIDKLQDDQIDDKDYQRPMNQFEAFNYEEFHVVKINEKGKRQNRILGINQYRIFNMNQKHPSNLNFFEKLITNSLTGTKYPERLIEDIVDIRISHQYLYITFKQEDGTLKEQKFDTLDSVIANKIEKKINFIRNYATKSSRAYSLNIE